MMEACWETEHAWLKPPFSCVLIGKSGMGKTFLLKNLIENWRVAAENVPIYKFCLFYKADQDMYKEMFDSLPSETIKEKCQNLPEDLDSLLIEPPSKDQYTILVFDDMQVDFENDPRLIPFVKNLIRVYAHHKRILPIVSGTIVVFTMLTAIFCRCYFKTI